MSSNKQRITMNPKKCGGRPCIRGMRIRVSDILDLLAVEQDRVVYYSAWGALMDLATTSQRKTLLRDPRPATRRGVFLSLLEEDSLSDAEIHVFLADQDQSIAALARTRPGGRHTRRCAKPLPRRS